jgi:hypothetical protein
MLFELVVYKTSHSGNNIASNMQLGALRTSTMARLRDGAKVKH